MDAIDIKYPVIWRFIVVLIVNCVLITNNHTKHQMTSSIREGNDNLKANL